MSDGWGPSDKKSFFFSLLRSWLTNIVYGAFFLPDLIADYPLAEYSFAEKSSLTTSSYIYLLFTAY